MTYPLQDWVAHHASSRPHKLALQGLDSGETRDWATLEDRVARLAGALRHDLGLSPGARVVLLADGNIRTLELQFACIRAGISLAPLNFRLTPLELTDMCRALSPALMVCDGVWKARALSVAAEAGIPLTIDWDGQDSDFERFARAAMPIQPRTSMAGQEVPLILFTSGSTGTPKAVKCTLQALVWQAFNQASASRVAEEGTHVFTPLPLFHAGGLNSLTNPVLFFGGTATIAARFDPAIAARFLGDRRNAVTHIALVPLMYELIANTPGFEAADFSALRCAILAGGRLTPDLQDRYQAKHVRFSPQYGGTETGPSVTALPAAFAEKARAGSCGTQVMHVRIRLVSENGTDVAQGEPGEIWLRGPAITPGYVDRATELDFTDGWFRTGDVARIDEDGCYYLVDRLKDMYKSGGENVSSAEVEATLALNPAVFEVAVIGVPDEKWGEVGLAIVVPRTGSEVTLAALQHTCVDRLARYKHPRRLEIVEALPRNVTGKIAKYELRKVYRGSSTA